MGLQLVNHQSGEVTDVDSVDHAKDVAQTVDKARGKTVPWPHWRVVEKETGKTVHLVEGGKEIVSAKPARKASSSNGDE